MFDFISNYGIKCPKILIYCRTQALVGWLFQQISFQLKHSAYKNVKSAEKLLFRMYHTDTLPRNKENVLKV